MDTTKKDNKDLFVKLNNGVNIPMIGIGTYRIRNPQEVKQVILNGLEIGYRLIDTAQVYRNEESIGGVLQECFENGKFKREDLFITSKIAPNNQGEKECYESTLETLKKLKLDYLDLMLIHWPGSSKTAPNSTDNFDKRKASWKALERLYNERKLKSIGISNYTLKHLQELMEYSDVKPMVLQMELHPLYHPKEIIEFCKLNQIAIQAYSSLGEGVLVNEESKFFGVFDKLIKNMDILSTKSLLASSLLKWALLKGYCIIPKTTNKKHLLHNFECNKVELSQEVLDFFDLCTSDEKYGLEVNKFCWDPETIL